MRKKETEGDKHNGQGDSVNTDKNKDPFYWVEVDLKSVRYHVTSILLLQ